MRTTFLMGSILAGLFVVMSCTSAPDSDEAKTTEAKKVTDNQSAETWKLNVSDIKIEWVGTKVMLLPQGTVPLKSDHIKEHG